MPEKKVAYEENRLRDLLLDDEVNWELHRIDADVKTPIKYAWIAQLVLVTVDLEDLKQVAQVFAFFFNLTDVLLVGIILSLSVHLLHLHLMLLRQ